MERYRNREAAGKALANALTKYTDRDDVIVLALPRGGVPVAFEIAQRLHLPLDVFIVRKLGVPGHSELAMGALAMGNVTVYNDDIINQLGIPQRMIDTVVAEEQIELKRRAFTYRNDKPFPDLKNKTVILVDDGIATGATMRAAIKALRQLGSKAITVAVPVADYTLSHELAKEVDELVCPMRPSNFYAVGIWYEEFLQTSDDEVSRLLDIANHTQAH